MEAGKLGDAKANAIEWQRVAATMGTTLEQYARDGLVGYAQDAAHALIDRRVAAMRQLALLKLASGR